MKCQFLYHFTIFPAQVVPLPRFRTYDTCSCDVTYWNFCYFLCYDYVIIAPNLHVMLRLLMISERTQWHNWSFECASVVYESLHYNIAQVLKYIFSLPTRTRLYSFCSRGRPIDINEHVRTAAMARNASVALLNFWIY